MKQTSLKSCGGHDVHDPSGIFRLRLPKRTGGGSSIDVGSGLSYFIYWLVVEPPLKNMTSSVGVMKFPIWKNNLNVPNHQPAWICLKTNGTPLKSSKVDPFSSMTQWPHNVGRLFPHFQTLLKIYCWLQLYPHNIVIDNSHIYIYNYIYIYTHSRHNIYIIIYIYIHTHYIPILSHKTVYQYTHAIV